MGVRETGVVSGGSGVRPGDGLSSRQWASLVCLTCSAFILNTSEFMPVGLLTDIARGFSMSEASCGLVITIYAWAVMLLSLPLMMAASRVEFKRLILCVLVVFSVGQLLSAGASCFPLLAFSRVVVASAHAVFWSIAAVMATRLVDARRGPLAIGMVAAGSSIAQILGLPLGRAMGLALGWRAAFVFVGAVGFALVGCLAITLPSMPAGAPFSPSHLPRLLKNRPLIVMYVATVLFATGYFTCYSYIEPYLREISSFDEGAVTLSLAIFGFAGVVGSALFSRLYDGRRRAFLASAIAGTGLALAALRPFSGEMWTVGVVLFAWGCCGTAFNVAFQSEVIRSAGADESAVAMSIFSGLFNLGIGAGSALGGAVIAASSMDAIGLVGAVVVASCFLLVTTNLFGCMRD